MERFCFGAGGCADLGATPETGMERLWDICERLTAGKQTELRRRWELKRSSISFDTEGVAEHLRLDYGSAIAWLAGPGQQGEGEEGGEGGVGPRTLGLLGGRALCPLEVFVCFKDFAKRLMGCANDRMCGDELLPVCVACCAGAPWSLVKQLPGLFVLTDLFRRCTSGLRTEISGIYDYFFQGEVFYYFTTVEMAFRVGSFSLTRKTTKKKKQKQHDCNGLSRIPFHVMIL